MGRLEGRVALVTGVAQEGGIGHGIASVLLDEGASVVITDIQEAGGRVTAGALATAHGAERVLFLKHDVVDPGDWASVIATVTDRFGGLDILVNNAGTLAMGNLRQLALADLRRVMAVNFESQVIGLQAAIPALEARAHRWPSGSSVVNVVSLASHLVDPDNFAYHCSKAASRKLTQCAAKELAPRMIRVNSLHPGMIASKLLLGHLDAQVAQGRYPTRDAALAAWGAMNPIGHIGEPRDMGHAVAYLASDEGKFVVGAAFHIDGGLLNTY